MSWTSQDVVPLRKYLEQHPNFIEELKLRVPKIVTDKGMETGAMTGAEHKGANAVLNAIKDMAAGGDIAPQSPYIGGDS
jgi:hypothetical protein